MTTTRKLAAIMFTDIVGYTALMGSDEDRAFGILRKNREIHSNLIGQYNGKLIKEMGDGMLVQFNSAINAVQCAIKIQKQSGEAFEEKIRVGIHLGDITFEKKDVFGDGVNIASRLQDIANPGGIYISESVQKAVKAWNTIKTSYLGQFRLKNVDYKIPTYCVQGDGLPLPGTEKIKKLEGKSDISSLAILPFENFTGDESLEYFVSGMHSSLIWDIGKISALKVTSKTSSRAYQNTNKSIPEIASELGVEAIVETSVLGIGNDIQLQVKLVGAYPEEKRLWIKEYKEEKSRILGLYNKVTKEISQEINIVLTPKEIGRLTGSRIIDTEAYDLYLKSHLYWDHLTKESLNKAKNHLTRAIEKDPEWAPLYDGLANVWCGIGQMGHDSPEVVVPNIYENLNKALELDIDYAGSHFTNATVAFNIEWNWEKAEKEFRIALDLNPNDAMSRIHYAHLLLVLGRLDKAFVQGNIAIDLDPLNPFIQAAFAAVLFYTGDYKSSMKYCDKALLADPEHFLAAMMMEGAAFFEGDYEKALEAGLQVQPLDSEVKATIRQIFKEQDYIASVNAMLYSLEEYTQKNFYSPVDMAFRYSIINNVEKMLEWLERGYDIHDQQMAYTYSNFGAMETIKDHPRFIEILKKMNLPIPG